MNENIYSGKAQFATYGTGALSSLPAEVKKSIDLNVKFYLDKLTTAKQLYNVIQADSADTSHIYHKYTQTYAEASGWTERSAPQALAEGAMSFITAVINSLMAQSRGRWNGRRHDFILSDLVVSDF
jgi:hypothetical protein